MRVLYACHQFFPEYYTGTERYGLNLARQMQRMAHHVSVLTYATRRLDSEKAVANAATRKTFEYQGVPVTALRHLDFDQRGGLPAISFAPRDPVIYLEVKRFLDESPPFDLLHCIHPMRVGEIVRAVKERGLKVILHLVDYWTLCPRATLQRPDGSLCDGPDKGHNCALYCYHTEALDRLMKRWSEAQDLLTMTDVVISPSQFLIDVFRRNGVNTSKFVYLPHGADYSVMRNLERRSDAGRRTIINLGFLGTLLPHKGVDVLVKAFRKIPADNLRLKIYGGYFDMHEYYSNLLALAKGDERIEFCGEYHFESVADVIKDIDMVVVPSLWYENAPLVISVAQMFGVPVIASRLGGMAEMVADGVNGFTFQPGDVEDLADRIRMIAANPDVLRELSSRKLSPPRIESEAFILEKLYSSLIASNGTSTIQIPASPRESTEPVSVSVADSRPIELLERQKQKNLDQCSVKGLWNQYFDEAEPHMERQWTDIIWPMIKDFDFSAVLELGPGAGRNTKKLCALAKMVYAVDLNSYALQKLKDNVGESFKGCKIVYYENNGYSLSIIKDNSITSIYSWDAAVHFDKIVIKDYVKEFSRVLVKGGRGLIHHSNLGESANDDISKNPHLRSNMSKDLFKEYCLMFGLNVDLQEIINWGEINDCISVFSK
jgi:glycosyltransferase involved in cell wall biosynthesis/ubiquinone/menaquinone biosynthesis C-methylase UbiE